MKIKYNHVFGCQEKAWIQFTTIYAEVDKDEEKQAVETGWLKDSGHWYQTRSTRLRCNLFQEKRSWPKNYTYKIENIQECNLLELNRIYDEYIKHKGYIPYGNPFEYEIENCKFLIVYNKENKPVAFTKFLLYNGALESCQFCWDYSEPKISLGIAIQTKEIEYAKSLGYEYLYLGPGYEISSVYKSSYSGFEWWDGTEWNKNLETYNLLCKRDTDIRSKIDMTTLEEIFDDEIYGNNPPRQI